MNWKIACQFLGVSLLLFGADFFLKAYVHGNIPVMRGGYTLYPYEGIGVFRNWHGIEFSIVHVNNWGAVCGLFAGLQTYLLYTRIAIIGGLLSYLFFVKNTALIKFALMLILTGAVGNVVDYFVYGHVVDMFYFSFWGFPYPVFNLADASISVGIALLLLNKLFGFVRARPLSSTR